MPWSVAVTIARIIRSSLRSVAKRRVNDDRIGSSIEKILRDCDRHLIGLRVDVQVTPYPVTVKVLGVWSVNVKRLTRSVMLATYTIVPLGFVVDSIGTNDVIRSSSSVCNFFFS